jgi:hypothetical protein
VEPAAAYQRVGDSQLTGIQQFADRLMAEREGLELGFVTRLLAIAYEIRKILEEA